MKDGATSRVVVLNRADIARTKLSAQGSDTDYSPWKTHEAAMWLKSAVRQLQKWVPTSAEFRREEARAAGEAQRVSQQRDLPPAPVEHVFVEGEVVEQDAADAVEDWPAVAGEGA